MILGVIEDALDNFEGGSPEQKEDAKNELEMNYDDFISNLTPLAGDNAQAQELLDRLKGIKDQLG